MHKVLGFKMFAHCSSQQLCPVGVGERWAHSYRCGRDLLVFIANLNAFLTSRYITPYTYM